MSAEKSRDTLGRFAANHTQPAGDQEDDEIGAAMAAFEEGRRAREIAAWQDVKATPMQRMAGMDYTAEQLEATVIAARKRSDYMEELTQLEDKISGTGRKLFPEHEDKKHLSYAGNLTEVEKMLGAFGEKGLISDGLDALGRLQAVVSVLALQPKLHILMGRKDPIGTLDKLVEEVTKMYPAEVKDLKAVSARGGNEVITVVAGFMTAVMVGTGMRRALMALVITKI